MPLHLLLPSTSSTKPTPPSCSLPQIKSPVSPPLPLCLPLHVQSVNKFCRLHLQIWILSSSSFLPSLLLLMPPSKPPTSPGNFLASLSDMAPTPVVLVPTLATSISLQDVNQIMSFPQSSFQKPPWLWPVHHLLWVRFLAKKPASSGSRDTSKKV